jgi:uncharacterized protein (DUF2336 family)
MSILLENHLVAAMRVARGGEEAARRAMAEAPGSSAELLYFLAGDGAPPIREAVARNPAAPPQADRLLAQDQDPRVRMVLAQKIAPLAPELGRHGQDRLQRMAWETLSILVQDSAMQVRAAIAAAVADLPDAPRDLILRLARDTAMPVAEPVIRFSPLLTDEDLLALLVDPPTPETLAAIARRPGLSETLADAIARSAEPQAIAALLSNDSAAIKEATLDALIAGSAGQEAWHGPLVRRPVLPAAAAQALAAIVAEEFLEALLARPDLDPGLGATLRHRLAGRYDPVEPSAIRLETRFLEAAQRGDRGACTRLLAEAGAMEAGLIERAVALRSAKALVSLCWKAGFAVQTATIAQATLGGLSASHALGSLAGGLFPMTPQEMEWQIALLDA